MYTYSRLKADNKLDQIISSDCEPTTANKLRNDCERTKKMTVNELITANKPMTASKMIRS